MTSLTSFLLRCCLYGAAVVAPSDAVTAPTCTPEVIQVDVPSTNTTRIALSSFSYCSGTLNATAYINNKGGDMTAAATLYYADGRGESTPLSAISLTYVKSLAQSNGFELWTTSTPVYYDGITRLLNITVQPFAGGQTYCESLNKTVEAGGAPIPSLPSLPRPYISPNGLGDDIAQWLEAENGPQGPQSQVALDRMFGNINPGVKAAARGIVVAAGIQPSQPPINRGYRYHWVRDSSLTMDLVQRLYGASTSQSAKIKYENLFFEYAAGRVKEQTDPRLQTGLGEPKFYLNNTVFTDPWSRPQNDGPATTAITLMRFTNAYLANGGSLDTVKQRIYCGSVKKDLDFVATNWTSLSYDIWEAVPSRHFYNALVSRRALLIGSAFARTMNDSQTATRLATVAEDVSRSLDQFWHPSRQIIMYAYGPVLRNKASYLDAAVIVGVVHGYNDDGVFGWTNDKVLSTAVRVATSFIGIFPVADTIARHAFAHNAPLGIPIGRFPEDMYNGTGRQPNGGNPWYMTTASFAQLMYSASQEYSAAGKITISNISAPFFDYFAPNALVQSGDTYSNQTHQFREVVQSLNGWGDAFLRTISQYTPTNGHLTEQYDRNSGTQRGVGDLTWSYASLLLASLVRADISGDKRYLPGLADYAGGLL